MRGLIISIVVRYFRLTIPILFANSFVLLLSKCVFLAPNVAFIGLLFVR